MKSGRAPFLDPQWRQNLLMALAFLGSVGAIFLLLRVARGPGLDKLAIVMLVASLMVLVCVWSLVVHEAFGGRTKHIRLWKRVLFILALPIPIFLLSGDVLPVVPRVLGVEVVGQVERLTIESGRYEAIVYRYMAGEFEYSRVQKVDQQIYENTRAEDHVQVWYLPLRPEWSGLGDDGGYLYLPLSLIVGIAVWSSVVAVRSIRSWLRQAQRA